MRCAIVVLSLFILSACAELQGARLVEYTDSRFYLRYYTWIVGNEEADVLADEQCGPDRVAKLDSAEQYYAFDIRYATFSCVAAEDT